MIQIKVSSPTRIDIAGGTLDIWPIFHLLNHKATVNIAINLRSQVSVELLHGKDFILHSLDQGQKFKGSYEEALNLENLSMFSLFLKKYWSKDLPAFKLISNALSPKGAGLGGSSSLAISICKALNFAKNKCINTPLFTEEELVSFCRDLESKLIQSPTGLQDYWAAVKGGSSILEYDFGKLKITNPRDFVEDDLKSKILLCYSGQSRDSAINNWEIYKKIFNQDKKTLELINELGRVSQKCAHAYLNNCIDSVLKFSRIEWEVRKALWPGVETEITKKVDHIAQKNGAYFTRVCGAGGGGVMLIFAEKSFHLKISNALNQKGFKILENIFDKQGTTFEFLK